MKTIPPALWTTNRLQVLGQFLFATFATTIAHGQAVSSPPPASDPNMSLVRPPIVVTASAKDADEAVELSPFVVKAEKGWNATETLMGTRLKTDLRDIPDQLETFTKDFMDDLAINTLGEATIYSINADDRADVLTSTDSPELGAMDLDVGTNIRGIAQTQNTRHFFNSWFPADGYNTDSFTIASGANPILFGAGNGGGILDGAPSSASMRNLAMVKLQYSSEDSKRTQVNINRVIVPNKLSFRVDGLWSDMHTFKKPNYDRNKRYTLSATFQPFKSTTIRASYENLDRVANLAPRNLPYDRTSLWYLANTVPGSPYTAPKPGYNNSATVPSNVGATTKIFFFFSATAPVFVFGGTPVPPMNWGNSVAVVNPSSANAFGVPNTTLDGANVSQRTLMDSTYFPTDVNVFGNSKRTNLFGDNKTVSLEQRSPFEHWLLRNLFLELAFNKEKYIQERYTPNQQTALYVDANLYLPAVLPGESAPRPNPNFGLPYIELNPEYRYEKFLTETTRANLAYELNPAQEFKGRWARWLGLHRFSSTFERRKSNNVTVPGGIRVSILDNPVIPGLTLRDRTNQNWATDANRRPLLRYYLTSPGSASGPFDAGDADWSYLDAAGNPARLTTGLDSGFVSATSGRKLMPSNVVTGGAANVFDSTLLSWQGSFLPDKGGSNRVVITYGERHDGQRTISRDSASTQRDFNGLFPAADEVVFGPWGPSTNKRNRSKGVVVHPWRWIGLSYHTATTFAASPNEADPYGNLYPGQGGQTKGYGLQLDLWKKIQLRVEKFEAAVGPTNVSEGRMRTIVSEARLLEDRVTELDPNLPRINVDADGNGIGFTGTGSLTAQVKSFRKAEGYELSINMRPTPNWNVRIAAADNKTTNSDIGLPWLAWVKDRLPVWQSVVAKNGEVGSDGRPATWATGFTNDNETETLKHYYETTLTSSIAYLHALDGRVSEGTRGRRANVITNYRFSEGKLAGVSLTGAVRWLPPVVIGYPTTLTSTGETALDISHPYRGENQFATDMGIGYRGRMKLFGGQRYSVQLNVRNVLDDGPTIPYRAYTDGSISGVATLDPRLFIFTFGLDF